jgi:hypothetical protein
MFSVGKVHQVFPSPQARILALLVLCSYVLVLSVAPAEAAPNGPSSRLTIEVDIVPAVQNSIMPLLNSGSVQAETGRAVTFNLPAQNSQLGLSPSGSQPVSTQMEQNATQSVWSVSADQQSVLQTLTVIER